MKLTINRKWLSLYGKNWSVGIAYAWYFMLNAEAGLMFVQIGCVQAEIPCPASWTLGSF